MTAVTNWRQAPGCLHQTDTYISQQEQIQECFTKFTFRAFSLFNCQLRDLEHFLQKHASMLTCTCHSNGILSKQIKLSKREEYHCECLSNCTQHWPEEQDQTLEITPSLTNSDF